ncbi:MAG: endonuclease III [Ruminococcaceae bacterium]|nr:endonuclease III [Oscillospiraceae bacterium]
MTLKEKTEITVERLKELYPEALCSLEYGGSEWKLLIMAILSAQCTDARVNIVSEELFKSFPSIEALADASVEEIETAIRSCGLYKTKAKNIKASCILLREKFGSEIPQSMDELLSLPGVGRKIANLMIGDVFGGPAIVTDTHCIRISERIGLVKEGEKDPFRIEKALIKLVAPEESSDLCHRFVLFGRDICTARNPSCIKCPLSDICRHNKRTRSTDPEKLIQE